MQEEAIINIISLLVISLSDQTFVQTARLHTCDVYQMHRQHRYYYNVVTGLVQSPCGKISVIMTLGGGRGS